MGSTHWTVRLFGQKLIKCATSTHEQVATIDGLRNTASYIGVYFSFANINAQRADTTSLLLQLYERLNSDCIVNKVPRRQLEIVQVVLWANNDVFGDFEASHNECISQMPWLAVPYTEIQLKTKLSRRFRIKVGVPTLVLLDENGTTITLAGKERLAEDPTGEYFPWKPRPVQEVLRDVELISNQGNILYKDLPKDSIKAFYFSANWCPPCRAFTPQLIETYKLVRKKDPNFNIIFVSSDRSLDSFTAYTSQMPWFAVPFHLGDVRSELAQIYGVRGIPTVLLIDGNGDVVSADARSEIQDDPSAHNYPWKPRIVNTLNERFAAKLHENPALILFIDEELDVSTAEDLMKAAALKYHANNSDEDELSVMQFLVAPDSDTSDMIKDLVGLEDVDLVPLLVIIDLPNNRYCAMDASVDITSDTIGDFVDKYGSNQVQFKTIHH